MCTYIIYDTFFNGGHGVRILIAVVNWYKANQHIAQFCAFFLLISAVASCSSADSPNRNLSTSVHPVTDTETPDMRTADIAGLLSEKLKNELVRLSKSDYSHRGSASVPAGDFGKVTDLRYDKDTNSISFSYKNLADYDVNGEVGVSDVTPLAVSFQAITTDGIGDDTLESWLDGNGDGEVGVSDVTPIAQNFGGVVDRYALLVKTDLEDEFSEFDQVDIAEVSDTYPPQFVFLLPAGLSGYLAVKPFDSDGNSGEISNTVEVNLSQSNYPPEIESITPESGIQHTGVRFTAKVTGTTPISYSWNLDGAAEPATSTAISPLVLLTDPGIYTISLTVANKFGQDEASTEFRIWSLPEAFLSVSTEFGHVPVTVTLDASTSWAPELEIEKYEWDYEGDGTYDLQTDESIVEHTYDSFGLYTPAVRITDTAGQTDTATGNIEANALPVASISADLTAAEPPFSASFDASGSTDADGTIALFEWDLNGDGVFESNTGSSPYVSEEYTESGQYNISVRITDVDGGQATASRLIRAIGWQVQIIDEFGWVGRHPSLALVGGKPAISYFDIQNTSVKYISSIDEIGLSWGEPVVAVDIGNCEGYSRLLELGGIPSMAVTDSPASSENDVLFIQAFDSEGTAWGTPITVLDNVVTGDAPRMEIIAGNPAVAQGLNYIRALDALGTAWGEIEKGKGGDDSASLSLFDISGVPALSYQGAEPFQLTYCRAFEVDGSSWHGPVKVDYGWATGNYTSLKLVEGYPAIAYLDEMFDRLKYVRANDSNGTTWAEPIVVYEADDAGACTDMEIIGGVPAVAYYNRNEKCLMYISALDATGTTWGEPEVVDVDGNVGTYLSFEAINGAPAIAYFDTGLRDLRYAVWY